MLNSGKEEEDVYDKMTVVYEAVYQSFYSQLVMYIFEPVGTRAVLLPNYTFYPLKKFVI